MSFTEEEMAELASRVAALLESPEPRVIDNTHFQVVTGQVIQADHVNSLANQATPMYPNKEALLADWPVPPVGATAYLQDVNATYVYDAPILNSTNEWHVLGGMRMGYGLVGANAAGVGQVIPAGVDTLLTLNSVGGAANKPGRGTWVGTGAMNGSVLLPVTGTYLVSGSMTWPSNSTGDRAFYVKRYQSPQNTWTQNAIAGGSTETNTPGGSYVRMSVTAMVAAQAGESVGLFARNGTNPAVPLTLPVGADMGRMAVHMLGAE